MRKQTTFMIFDCINLITISEMIKGIFFYLTFLLLDSCYSINSIYNVIKIKGGEYSAVDENPASKNIIGNDKPLLYYKVLTTFIPNNYYYEENPSKDNQNFEVFGPFQIQQVKDWWIAGYFDDNLLVSSSMDGDYIGIKTYFGDLETVNSSTSRQLNVETDRYIEEYEKKEFENLNYYDNPYPNTNQPDYNTYDKDKATGNYYHEGSSLQEFPYSESNTEIESNQLTKTTFSAIFKKISAIGKKAKGSFSKIKNSLSSAPEPINSFVRNSIPGGPTKDSFNER